MKISAGIILAGMLAAASAAWPAFAQAEAGPILDAAGAARRAQDFAGAEAAYLRALAIRPGDAEILTQLALVQGFQAHYDAALASILRAEAAAPADLDIRLAKARILGWMGRYAQASEALGQVLTARPDDADALALQGRIALYQNMPARARDAFTLALRRDPKNLDAILGLGDAARSAGNERDARAYYAQAQVLDPTSKDVAERLRPAPDAAAPRWQVSAAAGHSWLSRTTLGDWSEQSLRIERLLDGASVWAGAVHAQRFGLDDTEIAAGAGLRFADGVSGTVEAATTPDADFLPSWRLGAGLNARLGDRTFVLADGSLRRYATGTVKGVSVGLEQYLFDGRLDLTARFVNSFDPANRHLTGYSVAATVTPVDRLRLRVGYADAPESDAGVVAGTRSLSGGIAFDLTSRLVLRVDYLHDDRAGSYLRQELVAGLSFRF